MNRKSLLLAAAFVPILAATAVTQTKVSDAGTYKLLKTTTIGGDGGWDYAATDEVNRRVCVTHANKVVVIDIDKDEVVGEIAETPDKLTVVQTLATANGSRTMTLDPKTHKIYLSAADYAAPAAPAAGIPPGRAPRAQMVPNLFKVLVFGMDAK
jgi:hypothetical protein